MIVFKTLAILKIVFLALLIKILKEVVEELEKIQNLLGGLKNVDIWSKILSLKEWKLIPSH